MFCTNCGKQNSDSALFCIECGQKLLTANEVEEVKPTEEAAPVEETTLAEEATPVEEIATAEEATPTKEATPVVTIPVVPTPEAPKSENKKTIGEELKRFVKSPIVIIATILFTLYIVMSIVNSGNVVSNAVDEITDVVQDYAEELYDEYDYGYYDEDDFDLEKVLEEELDLAIDAIDDIFRTVTIIFMIPSIIICAGLWITVFGSFSKKGMPMTTSGITTIKVMNMISLIFSAISFVSYIGFIIYAIKEAVDYGLEFVDFGVNSTLGIILMVLVGLILFLNLFYYIKINSTLKSFKLSIKKEAPFGKASKFVAVILMISGIFQCLTGLLSVSSIATWFGAISTILFALIIFKYSSFLEYLRKE